MVSFVYKVDRVIQALDEALKIEQQRMADEPMSMGGRQTESGLTRQLDELRQRLTAIKPDGVSLSDGYGGDEMCRQAINDVLRNQSRSTK